MKWILVIYLTNPHVVAADGSWPTTIRRIPGWSDYSTCWSAGNEFEEKYRAAYKIKTVCEPTGDSQVIFPLPK